MIPSALKWIDAMQVANRAETKEEKEDAAIALVQAELEHSDKLGLERRPQSGFFRTFIPLILTVLVCVSSVSNVIFSLESRHTANRVSGVQHEGILNNRETCQRTNDARVASINEKRGAIETLHKQVAGRNKQLAFWNKALEESKGQPASPILSLFHVFIEGLREERTALTGELQTKQEAIQASIDSQAAVAIRPGSPRTDCAKAFPFH